MIKATTRLGGDASAITVCKVAHGLMTMTMPPNIASDEQAFEAIKAGIDALPIGTKMFLNSGEFYGVNPREANLELLARFFEKYPSYTDKAFLSVKGAFDIEKMVPDSSPENLRKSVDNILQKLRGTKRLDLYQCARVDPKCPIEETIKALSELIKEGKFDHIGMSESKASTLRRGHAIHPITAVEIEVSPWAYDDEVKNVISTSAELGVSVLAYRPLGGGFLIGNFQTPEEAGYRTRFARFKEENFYHNMTLVDAIKKIASNKAVSPAQLCIAWVASLGAHVIPLPGSSHKARTMENLSAADVTLSDSDIQAISEAMASHPVKGGRYFDDDNTAYLWG